MDRRRSADGGEVTPPADDTPAPFDLGSVDDDLAVGRGRPIGFWLTLVDGLIDRRFDEVLDEHGVTRRQWQLLALLDRGPATRAALDGAVAPFLDPSTGESSADHLAELVESGWVSLATDGVGGGRYTLTERGGLAHHKLVDVVEGIRDEAVQGAEPGAHATTVRFLRTVAVNLGWRPDPTDRADRADGL
ncbi:MarR family transcriptional regulator [Frigoribacterium sp. VKM Ac-2836]|uniref:MarR family transcriptional regulator n=1 Tax=Frigoribacterium sp. VKM Ac-2836 TaxID=2739014 RepID=UPI001567BC04|nr:MarR family transcriptional regulator [Frigoribacterium sp. VKM Ac-2836]NRD27852.1 MarR family transcriptional regulator [Frigoribacterium sp. VKM Ac-2836]